MITVIVPYWNSEQWIARCCDSLTIQRGDFEFILVNDGSTDGGEDIVKAYAEKDRRFRVVNNQRQKGVSGARNTGLDMAKGEWITFLDADDELYHHAHRGFLNMIMTDENVIQANHVRVTKHGTEIAQRNQEGVYNFDRMPVYWYGIWNKLFKASFLKDIRYAEGLQYAEDELFVIECLAKKNRIYHTDDVTLVRHFDNPQSLSHIKGKKQLVMQSRALEDFLLRSTNPEASLAVCRILSQDWSSPHFRRVFGK